jgi:hypothetical protein
VASLGQLVIELAANTARLQSDLGKAIGIAEGAARKIKSVFAFATGGVGGGILGAFFVGAAKEAIKFGDDLQKAAVKAGVGGKAISELAYAAKLADVDLASLSNAIKKMQIALSEANTGAKEQQKTLAALGLTVEELQKRKPDAQFELLAQRISELQDPAERARAAVDLFGKAGADLLPLFEQGAAGIRKAREEAQKLGLSFSDDQIKGLADADDAIKRLDASWQGFWTTLTAKVAPAISSVLDELSGLDTRSIDAKIQALESQVRDFQFMGPATSGSPEALRRAEAVAELQRLKGQRALENAPRLGEQGGARRNRSGSVIGFRAAEAAAEAAEAARKAAATAEKEWEQFFDDFEQMQQRQFEDMAALAEETREEDYERYVANEIRKAQAAKDLQEEIADFQRSQAMKLSEGAQIFKDAFMNAWEDMVNTGKIKWDELLKFIVAEFARRGIAKLFDQMFTSGGGSASGGGGFWGSVIDGFTNIFGGGRASGGPVQAGRVYEVGERGRELFAPGTNGTIIPNHALGGSVTYAPVTHIDARGASMELQKALPGILKQHHEFVREDVIQGIRGRRYDIGLPS